MRRILEIAIELAFIMMIAFPALAADNDVILLPSDNASGMDLSLLKCVTPEHCFSMKSAKIHPQKLMPIQEASEALRGAVRGLVKCYDAHLPNDETESGEITCDGDIAVLFMKALEKAASLAEFDHRAVKGAEWRVTPLSMNLLPLRLFGFESVVCKGPLSADHAKCVVKVNLNEMRRAPFFEEIANVALDLQDRDTMRLTQGLGWNMNRNKACDKAEWRVNAGGDVSAVLRAYQNASDHFLCTKTYKSSGETSYSGRYIQYKTVGEWYYGANPGTDRYTPEELNKYCVSHFGSLDAVQLKAVNDVAAILSRAFKVYKSDGNPFTLESRVASVLSGLVEVCPK